ncbi:MAG: tyrosine--tRNA ligase, partial [Deltaproteobacteria bacterium]|nr:tyrosine--tRNA ligase [Deltaproteobacteria bacterium]
RIQQGGVEIDGDRVVDPQAQLLKGRRYVIKAGKRAWATVTLK